jgi:hypothetical protein
MQSMIDSGPFLLTSSTLSPQCGSNSHDVQNIISCRELKSKSLQQIFLLCTDEEQIMIIRIILSERGKSDEQQATPKQSKAKQIKAITTILSDRSFRTSLGRAKMTWEKLWMNTAINAMKAF